MKETLKLIIEKLVLPKYTGLVGIEVDKNPMSKFYIVTYLTNDEFNEDDKFYLQFETEDMFRMLGTKNGEGAMTRFKYVRNPS